MVVKIRATAKNNKENETSVRIRDERKLKRIFEY